MHGAPTFDLLWLIPIAAAIHQAYRAARFAWLKHNRRKG